MLLRDRPVLEHIVEQHAEEAAFLWTLRDAATDAPHYKRHHLARLDERVEAHVDGLRVAGEEGWRIALEQLERRCEKGELFAAGVLALESGDMRRIHPLVAIAAGAEPAVRRGFEGAIAWSWPKSLATTVQRWSGSVDRFERYLALCACSVHRADAGTRLNACLGDDNALLRARGFRLAGELGKVGLLPACRDHLDLNESDEGFWAAWSAVLLGDRGFALDRLGRAAVAGEDHCWAALEVAVRAMEIDEGVRFIGRLNNAKDSEPTVIVALGHLGDPTAVPWLIDRMQAPLFARAAGESFAMITGADLAFDDLSQGNPEGEGLTIETSEMGTPSVATQDDYLPWPDPKLVRRWWDQEGSRFTGGRRYLRGEIIDATCCRQGWDAGFQRQRRAAAYEAAIMQVGQTLLNWRSR